MKHVLAILAFLLNASLAVAQIGNNGIFSFQGSSVSSPSGNLISGIGTNLSVVAPNTSEQPFLNVFKTGGGWYTIDSGGSTVTNEQTYLYANCLDSNGYPVTLTTTVGSCNSAGHTFTQVSNRPMFQQTNYAGTWVWLYDGTGTFVFSADASGATLCSAGRILITSSAAGLGLGVTLASTGSGSNYAKNFRLVYSPDSTCGVIGVREAALNAGELFNPDFKARVSIFNTFRFMDWMGTNGSVQSTWANRPPLGWVFWDEGTAIGLTASGTPYAGVPAEVMIALCNELTANCWFPMPVLATDDYITQFATLAHNTLNSGRRAYVEYANEVWNSNFPQYVTNRANAATTFGGSTGFGGGSVGQYNMQGLQQAHIGILWKAAWGADASRVTNVIGVQSVTDTFFATFGNSLFTTPLWTGTGVPLIYSATISNGSGSAGNILTVSAVTSGVLAVGNPVYEATTGSSFGPITAMAPTVACGGVACTGSGGTGTYAISTSQNKTAETFLGGGGPAPGGPASQYFDAVAIAPYFGYNPPDAWVSSSDGGLAQIFTEMNSGGLMPPASPVCTTAGTSTAYTVSSNTASCGSAGAVTCPPADQSILPIKFNQTAGSNPTLAVDGCGTAYPILNAGVPATGSLITTGFVANVSFMGATPTFTGTITGTSMAVTGNSGSLWVDGTISGVGVTVGTKITAAPLSGGAGAYTVTPSQTVGPVTMTESMNAWTVNPNGQSGGMLAAQTAVMNAWQTYASGFNIPIVCYESGQTFSGQDPVLLNLITNVQNSTQMGTAYNQYYLNWRAAGGHMCNHFNDIGGWGVFGFWSLLQTVLQTSTAKYNGVSGFISSNPCWWAGCTSEHQVWDERFIRDLMLGAANDNLSYGMVVGW